MQTQMLINGRLEAGTGESLSVYDPATGAEIARIAEAGPEQVARAVRAASVAGSCAAITCTGLPCSARCWAIT